MRIVSLLPAATEMLFALGLGDEVVGVSHECDFPAAARGKGIVLRTTVDPRASSARIEDAVARAAAEGQELYTLDVPLLRALDPDLMVTQGLCDVCAVPQASVFRAAKAAGISPRIVNFDPHSLEGIMGNIVELGEATGRLGAARTLVADMERRIEAVESKTGHLRERPKLFCMEWMDPPYGSGHWVPEMVHIAGGREVLGARGKPSSRVVLESIVDADPNIIIAMPCGFTVDRAKEELDQLFAAGGSTRRMVEGRRVFLVDGSSHFSRPGPRVVEGIEILAAILHPDRFPGPGPSPATYLEYHGR